MFEILGNDPTVLHTNAHSKATGKHTDAPSVVHVPDTSAAFHTYAVDWEEDQIKWYFDGVEVAQKPTPADMHKRMYMLATFTVGGYWPGDPDASTQFPAILGDQVDTRLSTRFDVRSVVEGGGTNKMRARPLLGPMWQPPRSGAPGGRRRASPQYCKPLDRILAIRLAGI